MKWKLWHAVCLRGEFVGYVFVPQKVPHILLSLLDWRAGVLCSDSKSRYNDVDNCYDEYENYYHIWKISWLIKQTLKLTIVITSNNILPFKMLQVLWFPWRFIDSPPMTKNKIPTRTCVWMETIFGELSSLGCAKMSIVLPILTNYHVKNKCILISHVFWIFESSKSSYIQCRIF